MKFSTVSLALSINSSRLRCAARPGLSLGEVYGDEAHAYVLVEARGTTPAGDLADRLAIVEDGLAVPGDASGVHGETDEPAIEVLVP